MAAIPSGGAVGREAGPHIIDKREAPKADESVHENEVEQAQMPIIPPPVRGPATASPSRFWPKVALGTVAVIAGFGYVRHLAKDQSPQIPGAFVTADSRRAVTSGAPAAVDAAIATRRPSAPPDEAKAPLISHQAGGQATRSRTLALSRRDEEARSDEDRFDSPRPGAPSVKSPATTRQLRARSNLSSEPAVARPQESSPQPSQTADVPQAGDLEKHAVKTGSVKAEKRNAQTPAVPPRAQTAIMGWQMPRPYRPYPPQYRRVYPAYPTYLCPVDPQLYWYPRSAARRSGRDGKWLP